MEGAPGFSASIGPLLIGLVPGVLLVRKVSFEFVRGLALFVLVGWLTWAGATIYNAYLGQSRLYFAIFPAWALLAAAGFEGLARVTISQIRLERLVGVLVLLSFLFSSITYLQEALHRRPLGVVLGFEDEGSYLTRNLGAYYPAMEAVQNLPQDSHILNLWEPRGLYCRPTCLADTWIDRWYLDRQRIGNSDKILESWQDEGFTHILLYKAGMSFIRESDSRYLEEDWDVLEELFADLNLVEAFGEGYELYRLNP